MLAGVVLICALSLLLTSFVMKVRGIIFTRTCGAREDRLHHNKTKTKMF